MENGKRAKCITFENVDGFGFDKADGNRTLEFESDYLGDHSENWIVAKMNGAEACRYNTRFLQSIDWEPA